MNPLVTGVALLQYRCTGYVTWYGDIALPFQHYIELTLTFPCAKATKFDHTVTDGRFVLPTFGRTPWPLLTVYCAGSRIYVINHCVTWTKDCLTISFSFNNEENSQLLNINIWRRYVTRIAVAFLETLYVVKFPGFTNGVISQTFY